MGMSSMCIPQCLGSAGAVSTANKQVEDDPDGIIPTMPASPETAQAHRRWREPPQDPQQLGDFRKALAATMESIERQLHCAAALNLDQEQVGRMQEEYSVLLYQMMHSRSPQARITKQRMFVGRCKKRLMDAQAKMHLLQEQLEVPPGGQAAVVMAANEVSMPALLAAIQQSNAQMLHNMSSFQQTVATLQTEIANIRTEEKSDMETITAAAIDAAKTAVAMQTPKKDKDKPVPAEIQKANRAKLEAALLGRGPKSYELIEKAEEPWAQVQEKWHAVRQQRKRQPELPQRI
ncbi:unnamed protein product, partial [Prorocentrum cordatum]